jgi:hypothetical protein
MNKPFKYTVICDKTGRITETNTEPSLRDVQTWENGELKQTKTVWIDTRYESKLRLYNYITYTRKGLEVPKYKPIFDKNKPILNF